MRGNVLLGASKEKGAANMRFVGMLALRVYIALLSLRLVASYESWTVREHQNQKYAYGHGALIPLILLAGSYR